MPDGVYRQADVSVEKRETRNSKRSSALRYKVAGFAAGQAIILAVVAEADIIPALAQHAEAFALAAFLFLIALRADVGHASSVTR